MFVVIQKKSLNYYNPGRKDKKMNNKTKRKNLPKELKSVREDYASRWSKDASKFSNQGDYDWMCSAIQGHPFVLEIGTGTGQSTLSLVRNGYSVISIEENTECLKKAEEFLTSNNVSVRSIHRESIAYFDGYYSIGYKDITQKHTPGEVLLIQGDIVNDPRLIKWLSESGPFDAIVCWLIGTHAFRSLNEAVLRNKQVNNSGMYRLLVQNKIYDLADQLLTVGGKLNIVDRGEEPSTDYLKNDCLKSHEDQAKGTSLRVDGLSYRDYPENEEPGVRLGMTVGQSGRIPEKYKRVYVSVSSTKQ
ncbi:class I SAM-dependent methyltransferase [Anaerospora hongkongensis]|uniref:class I SAM-dependent methyltransferase n=1 Tax=Anaerospora hongkongensis TaxID=244830 RepID=UPI0028A192B7|nr:class I SAM-dependent methyltransferase [Anaerospora hongkongensis]